MAKTALFYIPEPVYNFDDDSADIEDFLDSDFDCILDENFRKIFRAEISVDSKNSRRIPKPRKFVRSKQCLLHSSDLNRYGTGDLSRKLRVNSWKLEASMRLRQQMDFHKTPSWYTAPVYGFSTGRAGNGQLSSILTQPGYKNSKKFAVTKAKNELEKFLLELQTREITPEDYDKLLELDEKVKAKTVDRSKVINLPVRKLSNDCGSEDSELHPKCVICLENFSGNELVKELPCGHVFHPNCITTWLTKNSNFCPVDQLPFDS